MAVTISLRERVGAALERAVSINNSLVNSGVGAGSLVTRWINISAPVRVDVDVVLTEMGLNPADVDALMTSLQTVVSSITANLSTIQRDL